MSTLIILLTINMNIINKILVYVKKYIKPVVNQWEKSLMLFF
jgi:hypothetical protein